MRTTFGYPGWFPTLVGLWELTIAVLNFIQGGQYVLVSQRMLAVIMGGAIYSHAIAEGKPAGCVPPAVFFGMSCAVPILTGSDPTITVAVHGALGCLGFGMGYLVSLLGPGKEKKK
jgi:hypothetical protein